MKVNYKLATFTLAGLLLVSIVIIAIPNETEKRLEVCTSELTEVNRTLSTCEITKYHYWDEWGKTLDLAQDCVKLL